MYGLAVLIQPRNKFALPTGTCTVGPPYTLQGYRLFDFAVCRTYYCDCLLNICRFVFEDQQCRLFYYNSHSDFAPLGYASLIMHVTYYSGTSLLRAVYQFLANEIRGRDPASVLGPDRKARRLERQRDRPAV